MCAGKLVFEQLSKFAPSQPFRQLVPKYGSDANVRTFRCLDPLLCMALAQRTVRECLGEIEACSGVTPTAHYHLGIRGKRTRSNLADANESRDWGIYEDFAQSLIRIALRRHSAEPLAVERQETPMPSTP